MSNRVTSVASGPHMRDKVKGAVKDAVGTATGNRRLQAEGKVDKAKGAIRTVAGDVRDAVRKGSGKKV